MPRTMDIDKNNFIIEIKKRPAIWNTQSPEYDNLLKLKQWEEMVALYTKPGATESEKRLCRHDLHMTWKNLRDVFIKVCKRLQSNRKGSRKGLYKYYNQLQFLMPTIKHQLKNKSIEDGKKFKKKTSRINPIQINESKEPAREPITESTTEDHDRLFMLSLVQDFKRVPERLKSIVKVNMIRCIIEAQEQELAYGALDAAPNVIQDAYVVKTENSDESRQSDSE